jgi:hypothetical protein
MAEREIKVKHLNVINEISNKFNQKINSKNTLDDCTRIKNNRYITKYVKLVTIISISVLAILFNGIYSIDKSNILLAGTLVLMFSSNLFNDIFNIKFKKTQYIEMKNINMVDEGVNRARARRANFTGRPVEYFSEYINRKQSKCSRRKRREHIKMLNSEKSESKSFSLIKFDRMAVYQTVETWRSQLLEQGGADLSRPLYQIRPLINEQQIRGTLLPAGMDANIPIEEAVYIHSRANGLGIKLYNEQKKKLEEYDSNNSKLWGLIRKACENNLEIMNYIKNIERVVPNRLQMDGASLVQHILNNHNRENSLHRDLIEAKIHSEKIYNSATEYIHNTEKLISEAIRMGSAMNPSEKLKSCLTKALLESDKYNNFYQTLVASENDNNDTVEEKVSKLKNKIFTYDVNKNLIKENSYRKFHRKDHSRSLIVDSKKDLNKIMRHAV